MKSPSSPTAVAGESSSRTGSPADPSKRRQIRSGDLFGEQLEVLIEHSGEIYSLRQTSKGKLILTK